MKKSVFYVLWCLAALSFSAMAQTDDDGLSYFKEHVKTLGSDAFGGRKPMTEYETKQSITLRMNSSGWVWNRPTRVVISRR